MKLPLSPLALAALVLVSGPALADSDARFTSLAPDASGQELPPYLQCVPFAREQSGIQIYGDALTWWGQAEGRYKRGNTPRVGAVMAFQPHRNMRLGHVAAVSKIIDSRTVLLSHANWSPINGRRGQIERNVKAVDVSPGNDWSMVRVWYHPLQGLGKTPWPVQGFIYGDRDTGPRRDTAPLARTVLAKAEPQRVSSQPSRAFSEAFAQGFAPASAKPAMRRDVVAAIIAAGN